MLDEIRYCPRCGEHLVGGSCQGCGWSKWPRFSPSPRKEPRIFRINKGIVV